MDRPLHYHYFTLEQRAALEEAMRARLAQPGVEQALGRLHTPEFGLCEVCAGDISFARLLADPTLRRCPRCG